MLCVRCICAAAIGGNEKQIKILTSNKKCDRYAIPVSCMCVRCAFASLAMDATQVFYPIIKCIRINQQSLQQLLFPLSTTHFRYNGIFFFIFFPMPHGIPNEVYWNYCQFTSVFLLQKQSTFEWANEQTNEYTCIVYYFLSFYLWNCSCFPGIVIAFASANTLNE